MRLAVVPLLYLLLPVAAASAEPPFLDDRSSPQALVRSLYNAIDRQEFARALSYFAEAPAESSAAFAEHMREVESHRVVAGHPGREEAGERVRFELPVSVEATRRDGSVRVMAGCYTLSAPLPSEESYEPLLILEGGLEPADAALEAALPTSCGDGPELPAADLALERAKTLFATSFADMCIDPFVAEGEEREVESWELSFSRPYDGPDDAMREARLFRFFCTQGAYNVMHVYLLLDDLGELRPVNFVEPELDIRYEDEQTMETVASLDVIGFTSRAELVNSEFDEQTLAVTATAKWRGLGDASSSGKWIFRSGAFTLIRYEVDASYDGEINPETVVDFFTGP